MALTLALFAAAAGWGLYWSARFFAARSAAETAMDELQPLLARGVSDPALVARIDDALGESHHALLLALAGPALLVLLVFAGLWLLARRRE